MDKDNEQLIISTLMEIKLQNGTQTAEIKAIREELAPIKREVETLKTAHIKQGQTFKIVNIIWSVLIFIIGTIVGVKH